MRRVPVAFAISMSIAIAFAGTLAMRSEKTVEETAITTSTISEASRIPSEEENAYNALMNDPQAPPLAYWDRLAQCETDQNWQNKGRHGGGVGFFTHGHFAESTMGGWERFGGEQYADHPSDASKRQQVIVAMRTAFGGWYGIKVDRGERIAREKGVPRYYIWDRDPFGYWTWGCAKGTVGDPCGYLYDGRVIPVPHEKPRYCKYLKPRDYRNVSGSARGRHNAAIRRANARALAEGAQSVAIRTAWTLNDVTGKSDARTDAKCPQYWQMMREVGFREQDLPIVDRLMWRASQCNASKYVHNGSEKATWGLMQINGSWNYRLRQTSIIDANDDLLIDRYNLKAAYAIWLYGVRTSQWGWDAWGFHRDDDIYKFVP